jgi:hypothetical protein
MYLTVWHFKVTNEAYSAVFALTLLTEGEDRDK